MELEITSITTIPNISNYILEYKDDALIITPKYNYITEADINQYCLIDSIVLLCRINGEEPRLKYISILLCIYKKMSISKILQNTILDIKLKEEEGYTWYSGLNISIKIPNANVLFKEIIRMIKINDLEFEIKIQIQNEIIYFKI